MTNGPLDFPRLSGGTLLSEFGTTGLKRASGVIIDEPLPSLRDRLGRKIYGEMATDPVIAGFLFAVEKVIQRLEWRVDPAEDDTVSDESAEFVDSCLHDMSNPWDATLGEILTCLIYGWSLHEIVYKKRLGEQDDLSPNAPPSSRYSDGKIGWRKWAPRSQDTLFEWIFDETGSLQGMMQSDPWAGHTAMAPIPIQKALLFRTQTRRGNPEGVSLLRGAYRPWFFRKRIEEIEAIGIERDLAGLPVAWIDPSFLDHNATPDKKAVLNSIVQIVQNVKRNEQEGVVFPLLYNERGDKMFDLTLLSSGGQRQFNTDVVVSRYDQRIAMSVLADWLLLGHENVGSFALGSTKMDLWTMSVDAIASAIRDVINDVAIPRLLRLNGMDTALAPTVEYGDVSKVDLTELADYVSKFAAAGLITPDDRLEGHLREVAMLPPAENETLRADQAEEDARMAEEMAALAALAPPPPAPGTSTAPEDPDAPEKPTQAPPAPEPATPPPS